jgi:hypothetical protein
MVPAGTETCPRCGKKLQVSLGGKVEGPYGISSGQIIRFAAYMVGIGLLMILVIVILIGILVYTVL